MKTMISLTLRMLFFFITFFVLLIAKSDAQLATPSNFTVTLSDRGVDAILSWNSVANATYYDVYSCISGELIVRIQSNYVVIYDLTPNVKQSYAVRAHNLTARSLFTSCREITPILYATSKFEVKTVDINTVDFQWNLVDGANSGYIIVDCNTNTILANIKSSTTNYYRMHNLLEGQNYKMRLHAYSTGMGQPSACLNFTMPTSYVRFVEDISGSFKVGDRVYIKTDIGNVKQMPELNYVYYAEDGVTLLKKFISNVETGSRTIVWTIPDNLANTRGFFTISLAGTNLLAKTSNIQIEGLKGYIIQVENFFITHNPLQNGQEADISIDFINVGDVRFNDTIYISWHDKDGVYITDLNKHNGLDVGQRVTLSRGYSKIISSEGDYLIIGKYYDANVGLFNNIFSQEVKVNRLSIVVSNLDTALVNRKTKFSMTVKSDIKQSCEVKGMLSIQDSIGNKQTIEMKQIDRFDDNQDGEVYIFEHVHIFDKQGTYNLTYLSWYNWNWINNPKKNSYIENGYFDIVESRITTLEIKKIATPIITSPSNGYVCEFLPLKLTWSLQSLSFYTELQIAHKGTSWNPKIGFLNRNAIHPIKRMKYTNTSSCEILLDDGEYSISLRVIDPKGIHSVSDFSKPIDIVVKRTRLQQPKLKEPKGLVSSIPIEFSWDMSYMSDLSGIIIMKANAEFDPETGAKNNNDILFKYPNSVNDKLKNSYYILDSHEFKSIGLEFDKEYCWTVRNANSQNMYGHSQYSKPQFFRTPSSFIDLILPKSDATIDFVKSNKIRFEWKSETFKTYKIVIEAYSDGNWVEVFSKSKIATNYFDLYKDDFPFISIAGQYRWYIIGDINGWFAINSGNNYYCIGNCDDTKVLLLKDAFLEASKFYHVPYSILVAIVQLETSFDFSFIHKQKENIYGISGIYAGGVGNADGNTWIGLGNVAEYLINGYADFDSWLDYRNNSIDEVRNLLISSKNNFESTKAQIRATAFLLRYYAQEIDPKNMMYTKLKGEVSKEYPQLAVETWWWILNRYNIHRSQISSIYELMESNYCYRIYDILMKPSIYSSYSSKLLKPIMVTIPPHVNYRLAKKDEIETLSNDRGLAKYEDFALIPRTPKENRYVFVRITIPFKPLTHMGILHNDDGVNIGLDPNTVSYNNDRLLLKFPLNKQSAYSDVSSQNGITAFFDYCISSSDYKDNVIVTYKGVYKIEGLNKDINGVIINPSYIYNNFVGTTIAYDDHDAYDYRSTQVGAKQYATAKGSLSPGLGEANTSRNVHILRHIDYGYQTIYSHWDKVNSDMLGFINDNKINKYIGTTGNTSPFPISPHAHIGIAKFVNSCRIGNFSNNKSIYVDPYGWHGDNNTENVFWTRARYSILWDQNVREIEEFEENANLSQNIFKDDIISYPKIKIYPNPTRDLVNIFINNDNDVCNIYSVSILNLTGIVLHKNNYLNNNISIDLSNYVAGIYIVRISFCDQTFFQKLFIE